MGYQFDCSRNRRRPEPSPTNTGLPDCVTSLFNLPTAMLYNDAARLAGNFNRGTQIHGVGETTMSAKIDRRQFLQSGAATLAAASATPLAARPEGAPQKPWNVLYVISDQHQAACMGSPLAGFTPRARSPFPAEIPPPAPLRNRALCCNRPISTGQSNNSLSRSARLRVPPAAAGSGSQTATGNRPDR